MVKIQKCKTCGADMARKTKVCPACGAKNKKPIYKRWWFWAIIVVIFTAAIGSGGEDDTSAENNDPESVVSADSVNKPDESKETAQSTKSENNTEPTPEATPTPEPTPTPTPPKNELTKGDVAELNDILVTLLDVSENSGEQFTKPSDGNVFVVCEFEIENNSDEEITVSSIMCFDAYVDDYSTSMSLSATLSTDKGQLDGTIAAGKKMKGVIGYEVSADWSEIEVRFTPDFWSGKDIIFVYSK